MTSGDSPRSHSSGASSRSSSLSSPGTRLNARTPRTSSIVATGSPYGWAVSRRFPLADDGLNQRRSLNVIDQEVPQGSGGYLYVVHAAFAQQILEVGGLFACGTPER